MLIDKKYNGEELCPKCGKPVYGYPATSRVDNNSYVCSNCGMQEGFENFITKNQ